MNNIEEDIKFIKEMIKEYKTFGDLHNPDYEDTDKIYKAIENILAERKQNKVRIKELEEKNRVLCEEYCPRIAKIKDLIENETINISGFECIAVEDLEELLEESK